MAEGALNGLLIIDKPGLDKTGNGSGQLPTSHDVVQRVRRWSRQRRIGHTGTLDPMASGVLVLCLGSATRLVEYYQGHDKEYTARVTLGTDTDTYDALGQAVATHPVGPLDDTVVEAALARFRGEIEQRPPIYSALKQGGESLHRKARRGEDVTVEARPVTTHALELLSLEPPTDIWLRVVCSAGFYVRSLAFDIGETLGTGGHLSYLRRESAGLFSVAQAHTLAAVEEAAQSGDLPALLVAPGVGLTLPRLRLDSKSSLRLGQGQRVWLPASPSDFVYDTANPIAQAVDDDGLLLGIVRVLEESTERGGGLLCKAKKWLAV
ncbi:MAG: tRNA pseudouridine(55) synthase TruB [Caldilineaceae bacterium]|nr:tRNA pseudouridine(55) synthase TruB [Caldilineaceae bacterium]